MMDKCGVARVNKPQTGSVQKEHHGTQCDLGSQKRCHHEESKKP